MDPRVRGDDTQRRFFMIFKIAALLSDGHFHSGNELGHTTGLSRSGVWKIIKKLQEDYGVVCHTVKGKGYCIPGGLIFLDSTLIQNSLSEKSLSSLSQLEILPTIGSTNMYLLSKITHAFTSGHACFAEHQFSGKGRRGKAWFSPYGCNIFLSLFWRFSKDVMALQGLTLAMAVAVVRALTRYGVVGAQIKWPNDIYVQGKKLAGILVELHAVADVETSVVIGVGLNVAMPILSENYVDQPFTDVATIMRVVPDRNKLAGFLLDALLEMCQAFSHNPFFAFKETFEHCDMLRGSEVTVMLGNENISGIAEGVDEYGALCVRVDGVVRSFHSGSVSLKK